MPETNMGSVQITPADLRTAAATIQEAAEVIGTKLDAVKIAIDSIESAWKDANAKTYTNRFNELYPSFTNFKNSALGFGSFLNQVVSAYEAYGQDVNTAVGGSSASTVVNGTGPSSTTSTMM